MAGAQHLDAQGPGCFRFLDEPQGAGPLPQGPLALRLELLLWMMLKTEKGSVMEPLPRGAQPPASAPGEVLTARGRGPTAASHLPFVFRATGRGGNHSALIGEHEREGEGAIHQVERIGVFQEHVSQGGGKGDQALPAVHEADDVGHGPWAASDRDEPGAAGQGAPVGILNLAFVPVLVRFRDAAEPFVDEACGCLRAAEEEPLAVEDGGFDVHREASALGRGLGPSGQVEGAPAGDVLAACGLSRQPPGPAPEGEGNGDDLLGPATEVPALGDGAPDEVGHVQGNGDGVGSAARGRSTSSPRPSVRSCLPAGVGLLFAAGAQSEPALDAAGAPALGPSGGVRRLLEEAEPRSAGLTALAEADLGALVGAGTLRVALVRDEPNQLAQEEPHVQQADAALGPAGRAQPALLAPDPHLDQPVPAGLVPPQVEEHVHVGRGPAPLAAATLEPAEERGWWARARPEPALRAPEASQPVHTPEAPQPARTTPTACARPRGPTACGAQADAFHPLAPARPGWPSALPGPLQAQGYVCCCSVPAMRVSVPLGDTTRTPREGGPSVVPRG